MSNVAHVATALEMSPLEEISRGVRVKTHCLYPSNAIVSVIVSPRAEGWYRVDDDGRAIDELSRCVSAASVPKLLNTLLKQKGCELTPEGQIISPMVPLGELKAAIILIANTSKAAAEHLVSTVRPPRRNMRQVIEELLELKFKNRWSRDGRIAGASNKEHGFDYVIHISGGRQLALDFVVPDASSVNSAVVAHLDVKQKNNADLEQRIVYDDTQPWRSEDIQLLRVGARPVPLSNLAQSLERLAA